MFHTKSEINHPMWTQPQQFFVHIEHMLKNTTSWS